MPMPSYKQWVSRSRELSGFRDWAEKLGGWLCLIHDRYGPELREALRMEQPIVLQGADQELRARRLFHLIQQAFTGYPKIEHMIRNQIMARGAADVNGYELFRLIRREFSIYSRQEALYNRELVLKFTVKKPSIDGLIDVLREIQTEIESFHSMLEASVKPSAELIPFLFGVVTRAILVVWTICHLRSERTSFAVVHTEDRARARKRVDIRFHPVRDMAILSPEVNHCATTALSGPLSPCSKLPSAVASLVQSMPKLPYSLAKASWVQQSWPRPLWLRLLRLPAFLPSPPALGEQVVATTLLTRCHLRQSLLLLADQLWDFWLLPDLSTRGLQCAFAVATGREKRRLVPKTGQGLH